MRIISLSPSFTEILQSFGLHENLVGITSECPQGLNRLRGQAILPACPLNLGSPRTLEIEKISKLAPDLIVTERKENRPEEIRELNKNHKVVSWDIVTIPSLITAISELGKLTQTEVQAKELIRQIYQEWPTPQQNPVRAVTLIWNNPMSTVSARSYISHIVEAAGGWNPYREDPIAEVAIELEEMLDLEAEMLLLPSAPYAFEPKHAAYFKGLPAFSKKPVHLIDGLLFSRFGPQTVKALKILKPLMNEVSAGKN